MTFMSTFIHRPHRIFGCIIQPVNSSCLEMSPVTQRTCMHCGYTQVQVHYARGGMYQI